MITTSGQCLSLAAASPLEASPLGIGIWLILTFLLLFLLLYKTAWPKLLSALEERESSIRQALEDADRNRQESAALVEEHRKEIEKVREQAREILEEERVNGQKLRADIVDKAHLRLDIGSFRHTNYGTYLGDSRFSCLARGPWTIDVCQEFCRSWWCEFQTVQIAYYGAWSRREHWTNLG